MYYDCELTFNCRFGLDRILSQGQKTWYMDVYGMLASHYLFLFLNFPKNEVYKAIIKL